MSFQVRLPATAQTRCVCVGSMEHQQKRTWPMALVENPGAIAGFAGEGLRQFRRHLVADAPRLFWASTLTWPYELPHRGGSNSDLTGVE